MLVQLDRVMKEYGSFALELNMQIPENQIIGLIGANGAGKSTTFKLMIGLIRPDQGNAEVFGRNAADLGAEEKQKIGVVFSDSGFSEYLRVQQLIPVMKRFYPDFQEKEFRKRCERFKIPLNKQIKDFSTGMKAKLNVLLALSHDSRLLLLDEPTAGLDVVAREEILDLLREYMEIPGRTIVISSHISGDLEHFCDDLYMIHEGKIVLHEETDRILEEYGFLKVSEQEYEVLDKEYLLRVRKESFGYSCLTDQKNYYLENYPGLVVEKGSVDEVISMLVKGEAL
nr:ABC transporter ATP-binding protein [uncultured Blautia sp.]